VCGVDLSANKENPDIACAGLVVYDIRKGRVEYEDYEVVRITQHYVPGFLAFREVPPFYQLFVRLKQRKPEAWPELLILDGNGLLHQHQCGLACHLGVLLDLPSVGVGKTFFFVDGLDKSEVRKLCEAGIKE
jgi:deoxyinosine 3'endonuclease (endonuclease V)